MPRYRIHRLKDLQRESFRWAAHTGGIAIVKQKDYDAGTKIEAANPYAVWKIFAADKNALRPGDLLESLGANGEPGDLQIVKYIGFEPATWYVADLKSSGVLQNEQTADSLV